MTDLSNTSPDTSNISGDYAERLVEAAEAAAAYLDSLQRNMLVNDIDMLLDKCDPPEIVADRLRTAARASKAAAQDVWRHKKRGTTYSVVGEVRVQCETPLQDGETIRLYQSQQDGSYSCRRHSEFIDGRFEKIEGGK